MNHFKILKEFQGCLSIQLSKIYIAQTQYLSGVLSLICYRLPRRLVYNIIRYTHCQQLFSKIFVYSASRRKQSQKLSLRLFSLFSAVLRRICPHNKSAALSFSCGSSHTVQPKIVQAKRASFMYAWSSILSAACLAVSNDG